jgi:hypothetical protein
VRVSLVEPATLLAKVLKIAVYQRLEELVTGAQVQEVYVIIYTTTLYRQAANSLLGTMLESYALN